MATGFTHRVAEGKTTSLREFALECSRAMGFRFTERDSPHPLPQKRTDNGDKSRQQVKEFQTEIERLKNLTPEEVQAEAEAAYMAVVAADEEFKAYCDEMVARYSAMLEKVNAWEVPESLNSLKQLMTSHLEDSIEHDSYMPSLQPDPTRYHPDVWLEEQIKFNERMMKNYLRYAEEADERVRTQNAMVDDFLAYLPED